MKTLLALISMLCLNVYNAQSQNWTLYQHHDDLEFNDIKFLNANEGYAFADSNANGTFMAAAILKTTDGGLNWNTYVLSNPNYRITKGFFLNSNEGFIAGRNGGGNNGLFLKTIDGGVNWINPSTFSEKLLNVCFLNPTTGWVMGKNGLLSKTTDGGTSWNAQSVSNEDIYAMKFFNSSQGIIVCGGGEIYLTTDAGMTWNLVTSNVGEDLISIAVNYSSAWICGTAGTILYSTDYGQTWTVQTAAVNIDFNAISFPDGNNGYTAGVAGLINQTQNAGTLWQSQNSNCNDEITGLAVPDINHGWFCTTNGDIFSFINSTGFSNDAASNGMPIVYPNPANDFVHIQLSNKLSQVRSVKIMDMQGKILIEHNELSKYLLNTVSLQDLVPGIYSIEILADGKEYHSKFIKCNTF